MSAARLGPLLVAGLQRTGFLLGGRDLGIEQAGAGVRGALALPYRGRHFAAALDGAHKRADADGQRDGGHRVLLAPVAIPALVLAHVLRGERSEEHTSELQSLMRHSYAVFCLKKKHTTPNTH